jgi:flagellar hook protein FlgE
MLDVTANNIANVNTIAFKSSATQFQDTLSQLVKGSSSPQATVGGTNPAQVGLGVQVAGISTNFSQGSTESTGRSTDMMISGDGFFVTSSGGQTQYTRDGSFDPDGLGHLVTPDGSIVQGWSAVNGVIQPGGTIGDITLPNQQVSPAQATTTATVTGNLPIDAATGTVLTQDTTVYDAAGNSRKLSVTFTRSATAGVTWDVSADDGSGAVGSTLTYVSGVLQPGGSLTVNGIAVDMTATTGFAGLTTVAATSNGREAGTLQSFTMSPDGTLIGSFSNGASQAVGRIALATFVNPGGLEKVGASSYGATFNSGAAQLGTAGQAGFGSLTSGALEMSNVDLSQEFTNLIVAQRGFQANARIITTSDQVLQELTNLKQ